MKNAMSRGEIRIKVKSLLREYIGASRFLKG